MRKDDSSSKPPGLENTVAGADPATGQRHIPLTGWLERQRFSPVLVTLLALVVTFVLFQGIGMVAGAALLFARGGEPPQAMEGELVEYLTKHLDILLIGNSIGQVLGLALPAFLLARLHTPAVMQYLRIQRPKLTLFGAGLLGWAALLPVVQWLGQVNQSLPLPESIQAFDESQMQLIEQVLGSDLGLLMNLLTLAVVPAICEELIFRGYVQRNLERAYGVMGGIIFTGVIFGFYHLRLTQVLPLILLGIYLGYVLWCTRSLWTAAAVHLANNGLAVFVGAYIKEHPELDVQSMEEVTVPGVTVVLGMLAAAGIVYWMYEHRHVHEG